MFNNNFATVVELRQFQKHSPAKDEVGKLLSEYGWSASILPIVLKSWKPKESRQDKKCHSGKEMCLTQEWPGLCIVRNETRGRVVCTSKTFDKGDIVTDYHGEVLTYEDGLQRQGKVKEGGFIMFLKQQGIAIDASKEECSCHPGKLLYGRFISHSKKGKRTNLIPRKINIDKSVYVIFVAAHKIKSGSELFFDYGVRQNEFNEGGDLQWMNT